MSLNHVLDYARARTEQGGSLAELYGTEHFGLFLYALLRMQRPEVVVELGFGAGATASLISEALRENGVGRLWTVDNGSDWATTPLREYCQDALGERIENESWIEFARRLSRRFGSDAITTFVDKQLAESDYFDPGCAIDVVFADATASDAIGCMDLLRYYLPRMRQHSSIFIDRASTIHHAYLTLNEIVRMLHGKRLPAFLTRDQQPEARAALDELVGSCRISIVHLTEVPDSKCNPRQNSRAWIRIEPDDVLPHNGVLSFF
jgi:predicted O-methyltransferase YrrM